MNAKIFSTCLLAGSLYTVTGQDVPGTAVAPSGQTSTTAPRAENGKRSTATVSFEDAQNTFRGRTPVTSSLSGAPPSGYPQAEAAGELPQPMYGSRLAGVVRRAAPSGTIILTSPHAQKDVDELSEDLSVLNFIFNRNLERTFGDKGTEYRLGVPITMRDSRLVDASYLQDFGVLIKVHVPFPVVSTGDAEKKSEPVQQTNSDWEKARRALFGGDGDAPSQAAAGLTYDDRLVSELKKQMFDALKNAANIRHLEANESITVAIIGGANVRPKPTWVAGQENPEYGRNTVMTIRISKAQADEAAKSSDGVEEISKRAVIVSYLDTAAAGPRAGGVFGGYGGGAYAGYGVGGLPMPK